MIKEFDPSVKIRRGGKILKVSSTSSNNRYKKFSDYGLNSFKNFLNPTIFYAEDTGKNNEDNELNKWITYILLEIIQEVSNAAIFITKLNGEKIIYTIDHDFHFENGHLVEDDPEIGVWRTKDDIYNESFQLFDAKNDFEAYGLVTEIKKDTWLVLDS